MKRFAYVCMGIMMSASVFALAACGNGYTAVQDGSESFDSTPPAYVLPEDNGQKEDDAHVEDKTPPAQEKEPAVSPLAALDKIEIAEAFGNTEESGWSFALTAAGDSGYSHNFKWTSKISGREKFYSELGIGVSIDDTFGMRSAGQGALGVELFGGGNAGLDLKCTVPKSDSDPWVKSFKAGFRHDGDLVLYVDSDGTEHSVTIGEIYNKINDTADGSLKSIIGAAETIPDNVKKGLSLRLSVEKLIDLGFSFEIDDSDGLKITLTAEQAFCNVLLNDLLLEFLPDDWVPYIPRADFGYSSTDFVITLAFDANGLFKEYSVYSDVALSLSLEVPALFKCESGIAFKSGFSISAAYGD